MEIEKATYKSPKVIVIMVSNEMNILAGSYDDGGMEEGGEI